MMKKPHRLAPLSLAAATLALAATAASAQAPAAPTSTVQLYGQINAAVVYRDHLAVGHVTEVGNSPIAASWFGLRGREDLGGGMVAVFRLESDIKPDTGMAGSASVAGKFWNRQAFVGLGVGGATVTLGRQFHASTDRIVQTLDVFNAAGSSLHITPIAAFGVNRFAGLDNRVDDSVKLRWNGPMGLTVGASYGFNEGPAGRSRAIDLAQVTPKYAVAAYFVNYASGTPIATTGQKPEHSLWGFGGNVPVGPVKLYASYANSKLDSTVAGRLEQTNKILSGGLAWQINTPMVLTAGYYHDKGVSLNGIAGRDGTKQTGVLSLDYYFSKRTSVNSTLFTNRFSDGYMLEAVNISALGRDPAAASTNGMALGIKHTF